MGTLSRVSPCLDLPPGPDCAHLHEATKGVIPEGSPDITGIQIPALTPL